MSDSLDSWTSIEVEQEEYSIDEDIKEVLRRPLVDILVALMLINDLFLFLRNDL